MKKHRFLTVCLIVVAFIAGYSISNNSSSSKTDLIRTTPQQRSTFATTAPLFPNTASRQTVTAKPKTSVTAAPKLTTTTTYILNTNTKKFHKPGCSSVKQMSEKNKKPVTWSRQEVVDAGYSPCGRCNP